MNTERRSKTKRGVLVVILLLCLVALIGGTYARYTWNGSANATVDVAKWAVQFSGENAAATTTDVTFVVQDNDYVAKDKIAPASKATATVSLDLTGTEVDVEVLAKIADSALADYPNMELSLEVAGTEASPETPVYVARDESEDKFTGPVDVKLTLEWVNKDTTPEDADDTAKGKTAATITLPIDLTVRQYIYDN